MRGGVQKGQQNQGNRGAERAGSHGMHGVRRNILMDYAEISDKRIKYHISQTKLAVYGGFSKALISAWELGKKEPNHEQLCKLEYIIDELVTKMRNGEIDLNKKKIQHSLKNKAALPRIIKSKSEYLARLELKQYNSEYANQLKMMSADAKKKKDHKAPKAIALFSGCGGMTLGFEAAGINVVGHVEICGSANKIYSANFEESQLLGEDICEIIYDDIEKWKERWGEIDIIIGGPPCQGFSLAGKRNSEDERNKLYQQYVRIVSQIRPSIFVMENVAMMASMKDKNGELFINKITNAFKCQGYKIFTQIVNAQDYGVPQSRERVFLIGVREDIGKDFKFPDENPKDIITFRMATEDLISLENGEYSENDPLHWAIMHPQHVIRWLKDVPEGHSAHENENPDLRPPSGFNTTYKRICWDEPCSTIGTNFSMISGCRNVHPQNTRSLTIREAARAQSFPDDFVFLGNWGDIRKAIGNAVPPILAQTIASAIMEQFFEEKQ